jgi:glucokinase
VRAGVDLGGTKCLGVLVDEAGSVLHERRVPTPVGTDAVVDVLGATIEALLAEAGEPVAGVGVGVPGLVERSGRLRFAPNLPGVVEVPIGEVLGARVGVPVTVDNDATCAAWAEHEAGAAKGTRHAVLITLGTGIGAGIVTGGRIERGANGFAGEPGHMVVDPDGPLCPCGRRGCWERYASGSGLGRLGRDAALAGRLEAAVALAGGDPEAVRGEHVTQAAQAGDDAAAAVLADFGWWVALGIANLVNILDPEIVVIAGGLVEVGDLLFEPVRRAYGGLVLAADHRPPVPIVPAELGEHAGAIGAALLSREVLA